MSPRVALSAFGALLHDRSVRLAVALAVAVAVPVAVLFVFEFRSLDDLAQSSAVVLHQLSQETADTVGHAVQDSLKAPYINVLLRISQQQIEPPNLPFIRAAFDRSLGSDAFVTRYYVWSAIGGETRDGVLAYDRQPGGFRPAGSDGARLLARVRELAADRRPIASFELPIDGRPAYIQAQLRFDTPLRTRLTSFIAVAIDEGRLRHDYLPALIAARLRTVAEPNGFPPLELTLLDPAGQVVFPAGGRPPATWVAERELPLVFFERDLIEFVAPAGLSPPIWRVRTGYGDRTIAAIVDASTRPQRALMAALAALMAFGLFVVARAAAREVRLAELKSTFVASVSHDLKTPLALIQLFAETLELGRLRNSERAHEYYRIINTEARKLTRVIDNLLDFSRIEAGLRHYDLEPTDLGALVSRAVAGLDSQFAQRQFTVQTRLPPGTVRVRADAYAARQAIENLLSNAMKYSGDRREIAVEVDADGRFGRVRVIDHGIGIPAAQQRKIFRKFYRVANDAGRGAQGSGLGLAIVDHVMRGHGGFVTVESEPGRGSTFTLHFPCDEDHGDEADTGDRGRAADVARSA